MSKKDAIVFPGVGRKIGKVRLQPKDRSKNCSNRLLDVVDEFLISKGVDVKSKSWAGFAPELEKQAGLTKPDKGSVLSSDRGRVIKAALILNLRPINQATTSIVQSLFEQKIEAPEVVKPSLDLWPTKPNVPPRNKRIPKGRYARFYLSHEWRRFRYSILKQYGRLCMCCGETKGTMHVDHIKSLWRYWDLRLDRNNAQVLCNVCNHGKGNWDNTDFRPKVKTEGSFLNKIKL